MPTRVGDEYRRPAQWLHGLERDVEAVHRLVHESGGLAFAAWRVARARRCAYGMRRGAPSAGELAGTAIELAERVGWNEPTPSREALASQCHRSGLVLRH